MSNNNLFVKTYQEFGSTPPMGKLADNLRRIRTERRMSQKDVADMIGVAQNAIAAIEGGGGTKLTPKLARALKVRVADLDPDYDAEQPLIHAGPEYEPSKEPDLPLYASVEAGEGAVVLSNEPIGRIPRPAQLASVRGAYGVIVRGESMIPVLRPGHTVLIDPHVPPQVDDLCLFISERDGEFRATIKEYRGQSGTHWKVRRYKPQEGDFQIKKADYPRCEVVVGIQRRR
jgi:transcriptional regulator with XRE-family HTH domain